MVCVSGVSGWELGKGGGVVTHARFLKEGNGDEDKPLSCKHTLRPGAQSDKYLA